METPQRDDSMRTGTYLISTLILNYLMAEAAGPGVRQMSTVIKFYFNSAMRRTLSRIYEFLTFINSQRLALTANPRRDGIIARCSRCKPTTGPFIICTDNPRTALYYQL